MNKTILSIFVVISMICLFLSTSSLAEATTTNGLVLNSDTPVLDSHTSERIGTFAKGQQIVPLKIEKNRILVTIENGTAYIKDTNLKQTSIPKNVLTADVKKSIKQVAVKQRTPIYANAEGKTLLYSTEAYSQFNVMEESKYYYIVNIAGRKGYVNNPPLTF